METTKKSTAKIGLSYGVLLGILSIILSVILYVTNNHLENSWITTVTSLLIMVLVILFAIKAYKKGNDTYLSFSEGLKTGMATVLVASILGAVYFYIFATFIEPDLQNQILDIQREQMATMDTMTEEQKEQAVEMSARFTQPWLMATFQVISGLFFGFIISLIVTLILKKNNPYKD